jgi:hypothetical protein
MKEGSQGGFYKRVEKKTKDMEEDKMIKLIDKLLGPHNW